MPINLQSILDNAQKKQQAYQDALTPGQAEGQLGALTQALQAQLGESPFESAGFRGEVGTLRDLLAESADADAGRAGASGMTGGMAVAAGAGARSKAAASGVRTAAGRAEARQDQQTGQLTSLLGQQASLEQNRSGMLLSLLESQADRAEREKDRKAARNAGFLNSLTTLAGAGIGFALGGPAGAGIGAGAGGSAGSRVGW